jgi:hypothetical protein
MDYHGWKGGGTTESIMERTRHNLKLSLDELGLEDGVELLVADSTFHNSRHPRLPSQVQDPTNIVQGKELTVHCDLWLPNQSCALSTE